MYKYKYNKYKHKYNKLKLLESEDKKMKNTQFDINFSSNMHTNIMKLEFLHDLDTSKVKNKKFYDLIKQKEIEISGEIPSDKEEYLKQVFINYNSLPLKDKITKNLNPINIKNLSDFVAVFDNKTFNKSINKKLEHIFNIKEYHKTFVGNCEEFLTSNSVSIDSEFLNSNKKLKTEFLREAVLIGFLPKSKNKLIPFAPFNSYNKYTDSFELELLNLLNFCNESIDCESELKFVDIQLEFLNELKIIKKLINLLLLKSTHNEKQEEYSLIIERIEKVVFSMKEARDSFYIQEMLEIQKNNKNIIFITTDKILTFRCVFNKISVINILNGMIRYLIICKDSNIKVIGNPFEIFIEDNSPSIIDTVSSKKIQSIITDIVENPIISLKQNFTYYNKYLVKSYKNILLSSFINDIVYNININCIYSPTKKTKEIIETLYNTSIGINTFNELTNILQWIGYNLILDNQIDILDNSINILDIYDVNKIKYDMYREYIINYLKNIKREIKTYTEKLNLKVDEIEKSTYRFMFIGCYGYISGQYKYYSGVFFLLKMLKQYYPESKWNYKEIFLIKTENNLKECNQEGKSFYKLIQRLVNGDETVFNGKEIRFSKNDTIEKNYN
jgi:hypothetical protein